MIQGGGYKNYHELEVLRNTRVEEYEIKHSCYIWENTGTLHIKNIEMKNCSEILSATRTKLKTSLLNFLFTHHPSRTEGTHSHM